MIINNQEQYDILCKQGCQLNTDAEIIDSIVFRAPIIIHRGASLQQCRIDAFSSLNQFGKYFKVDIGSYCSLGRFVTMGDETQGRYTKNHEQFAVGQVFHNSNIFKFAGFPANNGQTYQAQSCTASQASLKELAQQIIVKRLEAGKSNQHTADVTLGHDIWVGSYAMVKKGVTIGTGSVIAAGATISKDVPPYAVVVGEDRFVRNRFDSDELISDLLESHWWDYNLPEMQKNGVELDISNPRNFLAQLKDLDPEQLIPFSQDWTVLLTKTPSYVGEPSIYMSTVTGEYCPF